MEKKICCNDHEFHCVKCGEGLKELNLGILFCPICKTQYLPSMDDEKNIQSLSWIEPKIREREWVR